jgi:ACS family hexuronate transporter-like MFS transporter
MPSVDQKQTDVESPLTPTQIGTDYAPGAAPLDYAVPMNVRPGSEKATRFRWVVLGLIFFAITINYIDRLVMAVLSPDLIRIFGLSKIEYGWIGFAFAIAYALGQVVCGGLLDRFGVRIGYAVSLAAWSVSSMAHAFAGGAWGFGIARGALGVAESPAYPAATKTLAEWFPKRERAFAFGFVNAGCNMGCILAPLVVPLLAGPDARHWQWAFIATGGVGLVWLALWIPLYRAPEEHPRVNRAELDYIHSDPDEPKAKIKWVTLLTYPQAWAFAVGKFLTDSMWWFYMTWFPNFLHDRHHVDLIHIGLPLVAIYVMADIGSLAGGWLSSSLIKRGMSINAARKIAMFIAALGVVPIIFAQNPHVSMWVAVSMLALAASSHQAFSSNLYTLVSDMFPKRAVASVAGLGGMCGYIGASIFQPIVGHLVDKQNNYTIPFLCAGLAYLAAFAAIHLLAPRMELAKFEEMEQPQGFEVIPAPGTQSVSR